VGELNGVGIGAEMLEKVQSLEFHQRRSELLGSILLTAQP
jgi:hypothetical protein